MNVQQTYFVCTSLGDKIYDKATNDLFTIAICMDHYMYRSIPMVNFGLCLVFNKIFETGYIYRIY